MMSDTSQLLEDKKQRTVKELTVSKVQSDSPASMSGGALGLPEGASPTSPKRGLSIHISPRGNL